MGFLALRGRKGAGPCVCVEQSWLLRTANRRYIIDQVVLYYSVSMYILGILSRNSGPLLHFW